MGQTRRLYSIFDGLKVKNKKPKYDHNGFFGSYTFYEMGLLLPSLQMSSKR
jgi:hypothetical protein